LIKPRPYSAEHKFILKVVESAVAGGGPPIFNSEQGSHFTSPEYSQLVPEAGRRVSEDGKGKRQYKVGLAGIWFCYYSFSRGRTIKVAATSLPTSLSVCVMSFKGSLRQC
jgi:hypothetical protein